MLCPTATAALSAPRRPLVRWYRGSGNIGNRTGGQGDLRLWIRLFFPADPLDVPHVMAEESHPRIENVAEAEGKHAAYSCARAPSASRMSSVIRALWHLRVDLFIKFSATLAKYVWSGHYQPERKRSTADGTRPLSTLSMNSDRIIARAKRYPWACGQPSSRSKANCSSVSTPSATTS
jgi:hypothetical protein